MRARRTPRPTVLFVAVAVFVLGVFVAPSAAQRPGVEESEPPPTTTIALSAPVITSTTSTPAPTTTTTPTEVLGTQESNDDDELALTGAGSSEIAAIGLALLGSGALLRRRARRSVR